MYMQSDFINVNSLEFRFFVPSAPIEFRCCRRFRRRRSRSEFSWHAVKVCDAETANSRLWTRSGAVLAQNCLCLWEANVSEFVRVNGDVLARPAATANEWKQAMCDDWAWANATVTLQGPCGPSGHAEQTAVSSEHSVGFSHLVCQWGHFISGNIELYALFSRIIL